MFFYSEKDKQKLPIILILIDKLYDKKLSRIV